MKTPDRLLWNYTYKVVEFWTRAKETNIPAIHCASFVHYDCRNEWKNEKVHAFRQRKKRSKRRNSNGFHCCLKSYVYYTITSHRSIELALNRHSYNRKEKKIENRMANSDNTFCLHRSILDCSACC